ncbi:Intersectin-2 [Orchesella cincta]|uniref:Intersectin-2 n=1 Tax=Orchesella cincta TaxID=48709 RepID=A0A1D2MQC2_ORCCI|nr:Intersectin-2 [Orchesella cincta]
MQQLKICDPSSAMDCRNFYSNFGKMDPWIVTPVERARHMEQFRGLNPIDGVITGAQSKGLLLQSGLPPPVLGQIWSLADANCDGKMDINEFSVACKLITMKLRGFEIPAVLPTPLKTVLASSGTTTPLSPATALGAGMITPPVRPLVPPPVGSVAMPGMVSMPGVVSPILQPNITASSVAQPMVSGMHGQPLMGLSQPLVSGIGTQPLVSGIQPLAGGIANPPIVSGVGIVQPMVSGVAQPLIGGLPPGTVGGFGLSGIPPGMVASSAVPPASLALRSATPPVSGIVMNRVRPVALTHDAIHRSTSVTSHDSLASPLLEWAVPNASRLKYTQLFNQNDRTKSGYLTGVQARNILLGTGLPQPILAQVWGLSDMDSDGRLGSEEFVLALHLCDLFKQTGRLPPKLTPELIPPSFRVGSRKQSIKSVPGSNVASGQNTGANTPVLDADPLSPYKRKENFDKGQAELDRRRRIIEMERQREREERERKEREEYERREKQRLEQEKRQMEERERQRMEMEENKRSELLARRQKEQDEVLRLKGVNHGLQLELSQLTDKVKELSGKITETRVGVSSVKTEIDGMRVKRDTFMNDMGTLKGQLKEQNNRMVAAAQEKSRLEKLGSESEGKQMNLKVLREKLQNIKDELSKKQTDSDTAVEEVNELKSNLSTLIESCKVIYEEYKQKRETVIQMRTKHSKEFDYNAAWGSTVEPPKPAAAINGEDSGYYRALYEFESRNPDELSFPAGAVIQKNLDIVPDPGWLSGIYEGKSGWFPESFVEPLPVEEIPHEEESQAVVAQPVPEVTEGGVEGEYYIALYPYESEEPGDLPFEAGELVLVTQNEGEWWTGQVGTDRIGIFPANYVAKQDEVATTEAVEPSAEVAHVTNNIEYVEEPPVVAASATNDFSAVPGEIGKREEPNKIQLEPHEEAEIKREISEINRMPPQKSPKAGSKKRYEIATVLANYQPTSEGQLTLTRGQLITVRKKSPSGWWEGELQAKGKKRQIGWFPGSYVKVLGPGGGSRQSSSRTTPIPFDEIEMPMMAAPIYTDSKGVQQY